MTDELEPTGRPTNPDPLDPTARVEITETPTTPPIVPLTPVGQESTPPVYQSGMAWATSAPAVPVKTATTPRRRNRLRWAVSLAVVALVIATSAAVAAIITGRASQRRGPRLRPGRHDHVRRGPSRPPGRPAPCRRRVPVQVPGVRGPGRARDASSTRSSTISSRGRPTASQTYTTDIKPWFGGELALSVGPLPTGLGPRERRRLGAGIVPWPGPRLDQRPCRRPGVDRRRDHQDRCEDHDPDLQRGDTRPVRQDPRGPARTRHHRRQGRRRRRPRLGQGRHRHATDRAASPRSPGPKAALASSDGDHVGFAYVGAAAR